MDPGMRNCAVTLFIGGKLACWTLLDFCNGIPFHVKKWPLKRCKSYIDRMFMFDSLNCFRNADLLIIESQMKMKMINISKYIQTKMTAKRTLWVPPGKYKTDLGIATGDYKKNKDRVKFIYGKPFLDKGYSKIDDLADCVALFDWWQKFGHEIHVAHF